MRRNKIVSFILAASCVLSAFGSLSVSAAVTPQDVPYSNTFDTNGALTQYGGWNAVIPSGGGTITIQENQLKPSSSGTNIYWRWAELDLETISSGKVIFEFDASYGSTVNGGFWKSGDVGLFDMYNEQGQMLAGIWAESRAAVYMNGYLGNVGYASKIQSGTYYTIDGTYHYKVVVDLDNDKWQVYQNPIDGAALQWKIQGGEDTGLSPTGDFMFKSGVTNHNISKICFGMRNDCSYDNIKVYQAPVQTATTYNMFVGDTQQAGFTIPAPANTPALTWESSNTSAATVSNTGLITAVGNGTAKITASNSSYGTFLSYDVTVSTMATSLTLDKESVDLCIGDDLDLTYTLAPQGATAGTITWTSSDSGIASVDADGKVTGVSKGVATITATGSVGGVTDSCTVNVIVPLTGLSISGLSVVAVGQSTPLTPVYSPANADVTTPKWRSGNHYVATVSNTGVVTGVASGTTKIYLSVANMSAEFQITVAGVDNTTKKSQLVSFAEVANSFSDIGDMAWAQSAIQNAVANGIMTPDTKAVFGAKRNIKRDEFVSVIIKTLALENEEAEEPIEKTFDDVTEDNPYYAAIVKAVELGIIDGVSETSFAPDAEITRQDMAVVIRKALDVAGIDTAEGRLDFVDKDSIAEYAQTSVRILSKMNIMVGKDGGRFDPLANATRAEAAVISDKITAIR